MFDGVQAMTVSPNLTNGSYWHDMSRTNSSVEGQFLADLRQSDRVESLQCPPMIHPFDSTECETC